MSLDIESLVREAIAGGARAPPARASFHVVTLGAQPDAPSTVTARTRSVMPVAALPFGVDGVDELLSGGSESQNEATLVHDYMDPRRVDPEDAAVFAAWWPRSFSHSLYRVAEVDTRTILTYDEQPLCPELFDNPDAVPPSLAVVEAPLLSSTATGAEDALARMERASTNPTVSAEDTLRGSMRNRPFVPATDRTPASSIVANDWTEAEASLAALDPSPRTDVKVELLTNAPSLGIPEGLTEADVRRCLGGVLATGLRAAEDAATAVRDAGVPLGAQDVLDAVFAPAGAVTDVDIVGVDRPHCETSATITTAGVTDARTLDPVDAFALGSNPAGLLKPFEELAHDESRIARVRRSRESAARAAAAAAPSDAHASEGKPLTSQAKGLFGEGSDDDLWRSSDSSDSDSEGAGRVARALKTAKADRPSEVMSGSTAGSTTDARALQRGTSTGSGAEVAIMSGGSDGDWDNLVASLLGDGSAVPPVVGARGEAGESHRKRWEAKHVHARAITEHVPQAVLDEAERGRTPAMVFPFRLDIFQREAIYHLENNECVFVAAHTSAGKTVIAEYAIALAAKHMTRCVYTSPIKALSNQKFRDFKERFGEVGLITGDVSINPDASTLIMTTEILRSMLYRGADIVRDIEWVIFDEVHYVNDMERGVVWEEVIIMLPEHVSMVFLSATTPNTVEFSEWIGRTKHRKVFVVSTTHRPVPLEHSLYYDGEIATVMDTSGKYLSAAVRAVAKKAAERSDKRSGGRPPPPRADKGQLSKMVRTLQEKEMLPLVVFAFSKKLCVECADALRSMDLCNNTERSTITGFLESAISRLSGSDRQLPQILQLKEMLLRGIGMHHGGLLPIMKEMVEILFGRGLCRVLFATETFAMGVNMPARTVVFNGLRKHDGRALRDLLPGEYIQMAGRAGRRGLDASGAVIIPCWSEVPDETTLHHILTGKPTMLNSQFRLTYNMLLNLFRVENASVTDMMKRSFSEFRTQRALAGRDFQSVVARGSARLKALQEEAAMEPCIHGEPAILEYVDREHEVHQLLRRLIGQLLAMKFGTSLFGPGRVVTLAHPVAKGSLPTPAVVLKAEIGAGPADSFVTLLVLCPPGFVPVGKAAVVPPPAAPVTGVVVRRKRDDDDDDKYGGRRSAGDRRGGGGSGGGGEREPSVPLVPGWCGVLAGKQFEILRVAVDAVRLVSDTRLKIETVSIEGGKLSALSNAATALLHAVDEAMGRGGPALVNPSSDFKATDVEIADLCRSIQGLMALNSASKCHNCTRFSVQWTLANRIRKLERQLRALRVKLSDESLALFPDFQQRVEVLRTLGYTSADSTLALKGRVAAEINTTDELMLTELIFEGVLNDLAAEEAVALLSALVFEQKVDQEPLLSPRLTDACDKARKIAVALGGVQLSCGLDVIPEEYARECFHFGLVEVVFEWARGVPFREICALTSVAEGTIVRCITRLDETCREVRNAARVIGDPLLYRKMDAASTAIKRDIVFAASLYVQ